jgi:MFS family permease
VSTGSEPAGEQAKADSGRKQSGKLYLFLSLQLPAVVLGLGQGMTTPVLPVFAAEFGVSVGIATLVFVAQMAGGLSASLPMGYVIDRFGRRPVLLAGPIITAVALFLTATVSAFWMLLAFRYIAGWGQQMWMLGRLTVIADRGGGARGRQITSMLGIQRVGMLVGPLLGGLAAEFWGLRVPFVLTGIVVLAAVIPSFLVIQETAPSKQSAPANGAAAEDFSWRFLLKQPVPILFLAQFFGTLTRGGAIGGGTIFLFGVYTYGVTALDLGVLSSLLALAGIPLTLASGYIMDRFGRKVTVVPGLILSGMSMFFLAATAAFGWGYWAFVTGFVWMQLLNAMMSGSMQTIGSDFAPPNARGRFFGIGRMVTQGGFMANPLSFGALTAVSGFTAAFAFVGGTGVIAALILAFLIKESLMRDNGK